MPALAEIRNHLVSAKLTIPELNEQLYFETNHWIEKLFNGISSDKSGIALVGIGGFGRAELTIGSDLDLLLLHSANMSNSASEIAEKIWYPIWDSGVGLDHSVRTIEQTLKLAETDLRVLFGLLDMRLVAGDAELTQNLNDRVLQLWRKSFNKRLPEIFEADHRRQDSYGDLAHLQNPNLKESRGGLRDLVTLSAIAKSWQVEVGLNSLQQAKRTLLNARSALHLVSGKSIDLLSQDYQAEVADKLGYRSTDELLKDIYKSARTISFSYQNAFRNASYLTKKSGIFSGRSKARRPVADGVVVIDNQIQLAINHEPSHSLLLRVAIAAAEHELGVNPETLKNLLASENTFTWDDNKRELFLSLLASGPGLIESWEALDQVGAIDLILPQWQPIRFAPQRNSVHQFTVDRHLIQTVVEASKLTTSVARPDILLMAALLHDIGKARMEDHSVLGAQLAVEITEQMGFSRLDRELIGSLVRHHLLLAETATKRDLDDVSTIELVMKNVKSQYVLTLLHQLTIADAYATSSIASSNWRLKLIDQLVDLIKKSLTGEGVVAEPDLRDDLEIDSHSIGISIQFDGNEYLIRTSVPDSPGVLAKVAGLLALNRLLVRAAKTKTINDRAVSQWHIQPLFGETPSIDLLRSELNRVIQGSIDVAKLLKEREESAILQSKIVAPPKVVFPKVESRFTVVEVRAHDAPGLLYRIANQIAKQDLDIAAAIVSTLGATVDDVFYILNKNGEKLSSQQQAELSQAVLAELRL